MKPRRIAQIKQPPAAAPVDRTSVVGGYGILQSRDGEDTTLSALSRNDFEHPWSVYDVAFIEWLQNGKKRKGWTLRLKPGFVNGIDPLAFGVFATGETIVGRGKGSALNRVGGAALEYGSGETRIPTGGAEPGWYPLLQGPVIPVTSYMKTFTRVPPFFKEKGVKEVASNFAEAGISVLETGGLQLDLTQGELLDLTKEKPARSLIGQDFYLSTARAAYKSDVTLIGNLLTGQLVDYAVTFDGSELSRVGDRSRVVQGDFEGLARERESRRADFRLRGALAGPVDDPYDYQFLFTFWLLGPEGDAAGDLSQWTPYIEYGAGAYGGGWWNFQHAAKNDPPRSFRQLGVDTGLAALVGRYTIVPQVTMGALEAEQQRIFNAFLNRTSNEGKYWN